MWAAYKPKRFVEWLGCLWTKRDIKELSAFKNVQLSRHFRALKAQLLGLNF
ncbi:hypothetical protein HanIR_Chr14g0694391 [Helianthus annuus]|nr:hypothetical protein HanIR_Chr14g0694391 [Helianthus annuus]